MSVTIQIPVRTHEDFGDSISKLIKVASEISSIQDEEIILDFSRAKMLNPPVGPSITSVWLAQVL